MTSKTFLQSVLIAFMATFLFACSSGDNGSGNTTDVTTTDPAPIVTIVGERTVSIAQGESYSDPGATALNSAGETVQVTVSGELDTSKAGTYTLTYTAVDSDGNTTTTTRIINVLDKTPPVITLLGEGAVTVEQYAAYVESGATAKDDDTDVDVVITGSVNTSAVGVYTVTYTATDSEGNVTETSRTVTIVDTTPPVITLIGDNPVTVIQNTAYSESGATAKDGDTDVGVVVTGAVNASVAGVYTVTYTAIDSAGNSSNTSRTVNVLDKTPPVITLNGDSSVDVAQNSIYPELGATAKDGDTDVDVVLTGTVDITVVGVYTITYTSTDSAGNSTSVFRTVNVVDQTPPVITLNGNSSVDVPQNSAYSELGATAKDAGTDVDVVITGTVDTSVVGVYTITYTSTDSAGNSTSVYRTVNVLALNHKAMLGPLVGAEVEVFALSDFDNAITNATSNQAGGFSFHDAQLLTNDEYYLVSARGGDDVDANGDGVIDGIPTKNEGSIYGLVLGGDIKTGQVNITAISDIAWRYIKNNLKEMSVNDLETRLDDISKIMFSSDITGDGAVTKDELLSFDYTNDNHKEGLSFNYDVVFEVDEDSDSIISTYHSDNETKLETLLEYYFGRRLSFNTGKDSRSEEVRIEVIPFGKGVVSTGSGEISYDSEKDEAENKRFSFYAKGNDTLTLTATPKDDTEILSWRGCEAVSADKSQCQVSLNSDHQIVVSFGYKETQVVDNLVDLRNANVNLDGDSAIYVTVNHGDDELVNEMASLIIDDFIVGSAGEGFLRKVTSVTKISDYKYNIETVNASLDEVIKQGTGVFSKVMTNEDIASSSDVQARASQLSGLVARSTNQTLDSPIDPIIKQSASISEIEGVELIPSEDPRDSMFTIKIGDSDPYQDNDLARRVTGSLSKEVVLYEKDGIDILKAKGEVELSLELDFGASYGIFSGLEHFKLIPKVTLKESLEVFIEDEVKLQDKDYEGVLIATIPFQKMVFAIGPVPVYITSQVDVYIGLDGEVSGKVSSGIEFEQEVRAGVVYNKNAGVNFIGEFNPSWDFVEPKLEVSLEAKAFLKPGPSIKLYGVTGPSLDLSGYLKLKTELVNIDGNIDIWKDKQCIGGIPTTAWFGVLGEIEWEVDLGSGDSVFGKFVTEHLGKLDASVELFEKEWLLKRWQIGGICDESKTPPKLKLDGGHINETVSVFSGEIIKKDYSVINSGGIRLKWSLEHVEDNIISLSENSGTVEPGQTQTITVTIDTASLDVGYYRNKLDFSNNYELEVLSDDISGSTDRDITLKVTPVEISAPTDFVADLYSPTIVKLTWDYPSDNDESYSQLKGYRIFQSIDQENWESIVTLNDVNSRTYSVPNLLTNTTYYFKIDAYTDDFPSETTSTSIEIPRIEPEGDCRAHFTGGVMSDHQSSSGLSEVYVLDAYSEYVGAGIYPDNTQAFPKAVASTFDGIAIDTGTKVTIYSEKDLEGDVLYEKVGPAIINNMQWQNDSRYGPYVDTTWKEPLETNYPQSVREWSASNMHDWSYGSLVVECGY